MKQYKIELLTRTGKLETASFFNLKAANNYYKFRKSTGRFAAGAVAGVNGRLAAFGLMRGGASVKEARAILADGGA